MTERKEVRPSEGGLDNPSRLPWVLLGLYVVEFVVLAFNPVSRETWWAENLTVLLIVGTLTWLYWRGLRFSNLAYVLMSVLVFMHTIGGHYTFAEVPFGWVTRWLGAERNHYDRIAHFTVGFYAFAFMEYAEARRLTRSRAFAWWAAVATIWMLAAVYEVIEWQYAIWSDPGAGAEFLGSQGDIWDAQKDMLADGLGAIAAATLYVLVRRPRLERKKVTP